MRLRRPSLRFRLWMLMVAVAVVTVGLWAIAMKVRSDKFRAYSELLAERERRWRNEAEDSEENAAKLEDILAEETDEQNKSYWREKIAIDRNNAAECRAEADVLGSVQRQYSRAARYPWLSIAPEPSGFPFPLEPE